MYLYVLLAVVVFIYYCYQIYRFDNSNYKKETENSYVQTRFNLGLYGEYLSFCKLEKLLGYHKILANVYIPKGDRETTEIDVIFLHETGIYVLESKNYSGWIFGNEKSKTWTQTFKTGKKERFYNPIWQNNTHIKYLKEFLGLESNLFNSIIVFSERCELKKVTVYSDHIKVINRYHLDGIMKDLITVKENILSIDDIEKIYTKLKECSNVSDYTKKEHIENINKNIG